MKMNIANKLLLEYKVFTGASSNKITLRILPALNLKKADVDIFLEAFQKVVAQEAVNQ